MGQFNSKVCTLWSKVKNILVSFIKNSDIYLLSILPLILGLMIFLFGSRWAAQCNEPCFDLRLTFVAILGLFTTSLTGVAQIYRHEAPGPIPGFPYKGCLAMFQGYGWIGLCWGIMIYLIYSVIVENLFNLIK
jgi:hypothetical protein